MLRSSVPLFMSRQPQQSDTTTRGRRRTLLPFALGVTIGAGIAGPLPHLLGNLMAGLVHAPDGIAAVVDPIGIGKRRILVMGSDVIGGNTDVMFTVQIRDGSTRITQVPRDTFVESEELGVLKANALYAMAGPDTAMSEVSKLISAPIDRHLKVNLDAVAKVADALGGVEVDVPKRMYYIDNAQGLYIDLYPGVQMLKGEELEGFLRFRHDEAGDLGRMDRQKQVLRAVFRKMAQPATLARIPALLEILGEDIHTDLSPIEITQLLTAMGRTELTTARLAGRLYWYDDLSYWLPDGTIETSDFLAAETQEATSTVMEPLESSEYQDSYSEDASSYDSIPAI